MDSSPSFALTRGRRAAFLIAGLVLAVICVALGWQRLKAFNWDAFFSVYYSLHWGWMSMALLLVLGTYAARVFRWQVMIRTLAPGASAWRIFRATAIGFTSIILLGRPGEFVRPWLIARSENITVTSQMAAWFLERVFDLLAVLTLFGFGLFYFDPAGRDIGPAFTWLLNAGGGLVAIIAAACLVILFFAGRADDVFAKRLWDALAFLPEKWKGKVYGLLGSFSSGMACCRNRRDLITVLVYTGIEWFIISAGTLCFFRAFPATASMSALDSIVYIGFVSFGSIVQIPGLGGGVQVAGVLVLTQLYGLEAERATGIAVANWLVTWVSILPLGMILAAGQGLRWSNLRQISKDIASEDPKP